MLSLFGVVHVRRLQGFYVGEEMTTATHFGDVQFVQHQAFHCLFCVAAGEVLQFVQGNAFVQFALAAFFDVGSIHVGNHFAAGDTLDGNHGSMQLIRSQRGGGGGGRQCEKVDFFLSSLNCARLFSLQTTIRGVSI